MSLGKNNPINDSICRSQTLSKSDGVDITFKFPTGKNLFEVDWLGIISRKNKVS